jgi:hypothetical protein
MFEPHKIKSLTPVGSTVLVKDMNFKERFTTGGIVLLADDGKASGIRPRWAEVYAVGPEQHDVVPGDWICVAHGRWTRGIKIDDGAGEKVIRKIDHNDILIVSDQPPAGDDTISNAVSG